MRVYNVNVSKFQSTLLREERRRKNKSLLNFTRFQSTLLREERRQPILEWSQYHLFQSTLLREERHFVFTDHPTFRCFNPRSCVRSDL
jgi:hypothetical protein